MYPSEDEVFLRPLFQKVDLLVNEFAGVNPRFSSDQVKRYLGAHVCFDHHTKFIGQFKPPKAPKSKLCGWSIYSREHTKGKKISKDERTALMQKLGAEWKAVEASEKKKYEDEAAAEKKRKSMKVDLVA
ncbi:hypothetical protein MBANPS3_012671, partial [Mucor bainieri]